MRRVVLYGSDSGLRVWGSAVSAVPGYEALFAQSTTLPTGALNAAAVSSVRSVRRTARNADVVLAVGTLFGAVATIATHGVPVVAIDDFAVRLVELLGRRWGASTTLVRSPTSVVGLTAAHAAALDEIRPGQRHAPVVHQPVSPPASSWEPDRYTPYLLCAGTSGRDLRLLCDAARGGSIEVRVIESGHTLIPARGTHMPATCPTTVVRYGRVSRQTYLGLLRGAAALVHPLQTSDCPVGIRVLLDAMATGVPVVATDVPSVTEYQGDGTASIVPPGDAVAMAEAIRRVITDESWARSLSEASRRHVERIASPTVVGIELGRVLRELE